MPPPATHVALSVVGTERLLESGYFRAKLAQEKLITASPIPYTIVRATQFGEFAAGAVILAVPTVALFMYLQRYIVGGLTAGTQYDKLSVLGDVDPEEWKQRPAAKVPDRFRTAPVDRGPITQVVMATGTLQPVITVNGCR